MKTFKEIKKLNFNDLAFFKGYSTTDAKWEIAPLLYSPENIKTTKKGSPIVGVSEFFDVANFDFSMRSNSKLDGQDQMEYLCEFYNKGIPLSKLKEYSENTTFTKALKFTGKYLIVNDILRTDQLLKIQKTWLLKNTYYVKLWSVKTTEFINLNSWATDFLISNGIDSTEINKQINTND